MATKGRVPRPSKPKQGQPRPPKISKGGGGGGPSGGPIPPPQALEFEFALENVTEEGRNAQRGEDVHTPDLGDHRKKTFVIGPKGRVYGEVPDPPRTRMHDHGGSFVGKVLRILREGDKIEVRVRMRGT